MFFYKLTIEVPLFLCYFAFFIMGNLSINLNMYKYCYNILNYPEANCSRLGRYTDNSTQELEKIVQPYAGYMTIFTDVIPTTIPTVISLMIGPWSDKYGRKPVLLLVIFFFMFGILMLAVMMLFKEINPWWLLVCSIPSMLCGGITTFSTVTVSYLNDKSTSENRTMRMVTYDIIQGTANLLGGLASSYLLYATSYSSVYGICTILLGTALVYTFYFCPESLEDISEEKPNFRTIFSTKNLRDLFKVALRRRKFNKRTIILIIILSTALLSCITYGEGFVKTLYLRNKFNWTLSKRNVFGAWTSFVNLAFMFAGTYFLHQKLKIREMVLVILSLLSMTGSSILYAIGDSDGYIYASAAFGLFSGLSSPLFKSTLGKLLVPEEMGKIFSVFMVMMTLSMLVSSGIYQGIYTATIDTCPEAFNYVSIGFLGVIIVMTIIVMNLENKNPQNLAEMSVLNSTRCSEDSLL